MHGRHRVQQPELWMYNICNMKNKTILTLDQVIGSIKSKRPYNIAKMDKAVKKYIVNNYKKKWS